MPHTFMDDQCDLPLFTRARTTDPVTSHQAAAKAHEFASDHFARILAALAAGPAGQTELAERTGLTVAQVSKRLPELRKRGQIERGEIVRSKTGGREASYRRCGP
jgi:predicted Rossmann fold nucleotide-binding protein DprA/Smf involved in DNA uptake